MGNSSRILVAQLARLWLAPLGTLAPTDSVTAMPTGWFDVGLFTPESLNWQTNPQFQQVRSHQSNYATRVFQTEDAADVEVDLQEWSAQNLQAVYGGGTITSTVVSTKTYYRFAPPAIGGRTDLAGCIEIIDGAKHYRRIIPRLSEQQGVQQSFNKTRESTLPYRGTVIGADVGDAWYDLSDDPAMAPSS